MKRPFMAVCLLFSRASTLSVFADSTSLKLDKLKVKPKESITVEFYAPEMSSLSWIGVVPSEIPHGSESTNDQFDLDYRYRGDKAKDNAAFKAPATPGKYDLRLNNADTGKEVASVSFEVIGFDSQKANLLLSNTAFYPGQAIQLQVQLPEQLPDDAWIGLIPSDVPHSDEKTNDQFDIDYRYVNTAKNGTLNFTAPEQPGSYDFRLNDTAGGQELASVSFTVAARDTSSAKITLTKSNWEPGIDMTVRFSVPPGLPNNAWIGIVVSDVSHGDGRTNSANALDWRYLEGVAQGQLMFKTPTVAGKYDLRLHETEYGREIASTGFVVDHSLDAQTMAKQLDTTGKLTVYGIYFDTDKAEIKTQSDAVLQEIAKLLQSQPQLRLSIQGHTDNVGDPAYNLRLSKQRADAVAEYLEKNYSINRSRLTTGGFGDKQPVADNNSQNGRALNRRVELIKLAS